MKVVSRYIFVVFFGYSNEAIILNDDELDENVIPWTLYPESDVSYQSKRFYITNH